ncbi:MAG TPA: phage holin family protein [Candidatus Baltobacteraceae bacterium]|nr:phage holin family protein [Candidatus Baltobacteraceae bacterium]
MMIEETEKPAADAANGHANVGVASKRVARRLLSIFENRFELALVEIQEEREKVLRSLWYAMIASVFALLAGIVLTILIAITFWGNHPIAALLALMALYLSIAVIFYFRLAKLQRDWETLPATIEQLRKDRECLGKNLS